MIVLFLANAWGFCVANWKLLLLILAGVIVFFWLVSFSLCSRNKPKIDLETVNKINSANEKERKLELQKVIEQNADTVRTVDNRTTVAETNVVERNKKIDEKIAEVDKKIQEAKAGGKDVSSEELECILTGNCQ